ncbi:ABC transporter permease [Halomicrobium katesii]|uniref:ABC transporter permease n=1 Tax=Halomicrobium katesii TaxID=437163 RepID=UPI00037EA28A|nr:ABC transporter permease [Halomicrobium katesii]
MASDRSLDPRLVIARRDLASLGREKTIVLAILIQLFVAAFSSFLVVGLTSLYDPGSVESGGIEMAVTGDAQQELFEAVAETEGVQPVAFDATDDAQQAFNVGRVDAVVTGTYDSPPDSDGRVIEVTAIAPDGSIRTTLIVVQLREVLKTLERNERFERADSLDAPPLELPPEANASPYFSFTYTVLIPLLLFLPPFISGSVAVDTITEEIERGTLELLRVAPVSLVDVVDGKSLAMIALAPAQAALWIGLLAVNGIAVSNPLALLVFVAATATIVVVFGVVLGLQLGRRRPAQLLYSVLTLVVFGAAILLPEHPSTTAAKLAVDSPSLVTYGHVAGYVVAAVVLSVVARRYVARVEPESL